MSGLIDGKCDVSECPVTEYIAKNELRLAKLLCLAKSDPSLLPECLIEALAQQLSTGPKQPTETTKTS